MNPALAGHVDRASESIRAANHAALDPVTGSDAYAVVGSLAELVHRLPQLLDYLGRGLRRADPGEHYDDRGTDPINTLQAAAYAIAAATGHLDLVSFQLANAHNHLGHLGRRLTED